MKPVEDGISSDFASRKGKHSGIDYRSSRGTVVKASEAGVVVRALENQPTETRKKAYGNVIVINHTPDYGKKDKKTKRHIYTLYAHLDEMLVKGKQRVKKGDEIGLAGKTGSVRSTGTGDGSHLHFEIIDSKNGAMNWATTDINKGAMNVKSGVNRKDPKPYFITGTEIKDYPDPLTDEELGKFHEAIEFDMRTDAAPALLVTLPEFRAFVKEVRGTYPPPDTEMPGVTINFSNLFSPEFRIFFPVLDLEVNGKNLGKIQTGTTSYQINLWD